MCARNLATPCRWCSMAASARSDLESTIVSCLGWRGAAAAARDKSRSHSCATRSVSWPVRTAADSPRVPGSSLAHYAPATPLAIGGRRADRTAGGRALTRRHAHRSAGAALAAGQLPARDLGQCRHAPRSATRMICMRTCAPWIRRVPRACWCRRCPGRALGRGARSPDTRGGGHSARIRRSALIRGAISIPSSRHTCAAWSASSARRC